MFVIPAHPIEWLQQEITFKFADRAEVPGWLGIDVQSEAQGNDGREVQNVGNEIWVTDVMLQYLTIVIICLWLYMYIYIYYYYIKHIYIYTYIYIYIHIYI